MNIKLNTALVGGLLALTSFLIHAKADEWDKKTEFTFSGPVQIPGKVLPAGKYVFELADSDSDRNIVQVFSQDSDGKQSLVATVLAVPDYMTETPEKPVIHFEERSGGNPEAIHNWFCPGDNTGWQFVYSKDQAAEALNNVDASSNQQANKTTTPTPAPVAAAAIPSQMPKPPTIRVRGTEAASEVAVLEDEVLVAQNEIPPAAPAQARDNRSTADAVLPRTGGNADLDLVTGLVLLSSGMTSVFISCRRRHLGGKSVV
jgi:hypothetical protein